MTTPINEAKKLVATVLEEKGFHGHKLTARTRSFRAFGYDQAVFVTVHDWTPNPAAAEIRAATPKGIVVDFELNQHR